MITAYDCQGYAGGFASAVKRVGFDIVAKAEQADQFGMDAWMVNQGWLAPNLRSAFSGPPPDWPIHDVDVVYGNPPCSAFSSLTNRAQSPDMVGVEGKQNHCMFDLVTFGAKCNASVVVFESVRAAGTRGFGLMTELHTLLETLTDYDWHLTLVFLNNLSVGGFQNRSRMFFVASRIGPVAMPQPTPGRPPLHKSIGDLRRKAKYTHDWSDLRGYSVTPRTQRFMEMTTYLQSKGDDWQQKEMAPVAYNRAVALGMKPWQHANTGEPLRCDTIPGAYVGWRWPWHEPAKVVSGGFTTTAFHPLENRPFTWLEHGRLMGFPPEYDLRAITERKSHGCLYWGKATPVQSAEYVMRGIESHLVGRWEPIEPQETDHPRRWQIDIDRLWRTAA